MRLHLHKWKYLGKERSYIENIYQRGLIGDVSIIKENVTYVRSVCERCGEIRTQTVKGTLSNAELVDTGVLDDSLN